MSLVVFMKSTKDLIMSSGFCESTKDIICLVVFMKSTKDLIMSSCLYEKYQRSQSTSFVWKIANCWVKCVADFMHISDLSIMILYTTLMYFIDVLHLCTTLMYYICVLH